jgi:hypothetical protein
MEETTKAKLSARLHDTMQFIASKSRRIVPIYDKIDDVFKEYEKYRAIIHI